MLISEYDVISKALKSREDVANCVAEHGGRHSYETLLAVYEQGYMRYMARSSHLAKRYGENIVADFDNGQSLLDVAELINLSPCMVVRRFLELKLDLGRQAITKMLRRPELIEDERIREAVKECLRSDEHAGPYVDRQRAVIGLEYEFLLMEKLRNLGLEFETERELRARGTFKTPDVLLSVPVAFDGHVVRWMDSKAKFGDEYFLRKDYTDSISSYIGRFGPGMVIYWFGYIEDVDTPILHDSGVHVVDHLPPDIEMLPGTTSMVLRAGTSQR